MNLRSIGFTGTQDGMTEEQKLSLGYALRKFHGQFGFLRHGKCIGSDYEAHLIAVAQGYSIIVHPPTNKSKEADLDKLTNIIKLRPGQTVDILPPEEYLVRNRQIVDASQWLIAAPKTREEQLRSGTWSTVRYAKKKGIGVLILFPDTVWLGN